MGVDVADPMVADALAGGDWPDEWEARFKAELVPGERLSWAGRPVEGPAADGTLRNFVLWIVVACFVATIGSAILRGDRRFETVGLVLLGAGGAVGFILIVSLILNQKERRDEQLRRMRTFYALTDRRAIRWGAVANTRGIEVTTVGIRSIGSSHRVEFPGDVGDVIFGGNVPHGSFQGFLGVADVRRVEALACTILIDPGYRWRDPSPDEDG